MTFLVRSSVLALAVALVALIISPTSGFSVIPTTTSSKSSSTSLAGFGDAFKGAFANDDSLGKPKNEGLKGGPKYNEQVTINGKPVKAIVGQDVKNVARDARVKIAYNCQNGECGTCEIKMNGRKVRACVSKIPSGKCNIVTLS